MVARFPARGSIGMSHVVPRARVFAGVLIARFLSDRVDHDAKAGAVEITFRPFGIRQLSQTLCTQGAQP